MKVNLQLREERRFQLRFERSDYEPDALNALYKAAKSLRQEHPDAVVDIQADKEVGLTLLISPGRLAFTLAYLLTVPETDRSAESA